MPSVLTKLMLLGQVSGDGAAPWYRNGSALANSVVALWKLDEASGTRADSVGSNTLTDNNTVTSAQGLVYPLSALFVAANNEYLSIGDNAALSTGDIDFWLSAWVRLVSKPTLAPIVFKWSQAGGAAREYGLSYIGGATDRFALSVSNGTSQDTLNASTFGSPSLNTWYFVCARHVASESKTYLSVNAGVEDSASLGFDVADSATGLAIGSYSNGLSSWFDGRIEQVAIGKNYNPTAQDIALIYNGGIGRA
jgi:hypothetical protein